MGCSENSSAPVGGVCNFLSSVSLQQKFAAMDGPVLQLCFSSVLFRKQRKIHPQVMRAGRPKEHEEKRSPLSPALNFGSSLCLLFLLPLSLPYVNWASQEGYLFYLRFSLFLCSIFLGFSLLCLLAPPIWIPFSYPTT